MTISTRLDKDLEQALQIRVARGDVTASDFIRAAIREKLTREASAPSPYELGKDLFGRYRSDRTDRSTNRKALIRERLHEKHRR